jgi:hypothetical protein
MRALSRAWMVLQVPGHVRIDNLAKHSQSIQVGGLQRWRPN